MYQQYRQHGSEGHGNAGRNNIQVGARASAWLLTPICDTWMVVIYHWNRHLFTSILRWEFAGLACLLWAFNDSMEYASFLQPSTSGDRTIQISLYKVGGFPNAFQSGDIDLKCSRFPLSDSPPFSDPHDSKLCVGSTGNTETLVNRSRVTAMLVISRLSRSLAEVGHEVDSCSICHQYKNFALCNLRDSSITSHHHA